MPKPTHAHLPLLFGALLVAPACTSSSELFCESHDDCADVEGRPFCDLTGEFPGSEGHGKTCIASPFDAGVDDPGDPGDPGDPDAGGTACPLGQDDSGTRCLEVDPSNGLAAALDDAADQPAVTLPDGTTIDTDTGTVTSSSGAIGVATTTVAQPGGRDLRVFMASSFALHDVRVEGTLPVAFVASGDVEVAGLIDVSADGDRGGPGAHDCGVDGGGGEPTGGHYARYGSENGSPLYVWSSGGGGGGGFGTAGADGGTFGPGEEVEHPGGVGGSVNGSPAMIPLRGGCRGSGSEPSYGGAGGGAVQIASGRTIIVKAAAGVHAGGGGGRGADTGAPQEDLPQHSSGGGGSGGGVLLEAPDVHFEASALLLTAGGGGGGAGKCETGRHGEDAPPNAGTASGGVCPPEGGLVGQPATGGAGASVSAAQPGSHAERAAGASGGGGAGRIRINSSDGTYAGEQGVTVRGTLTTGVVGAR